MLPFKRNLYSCLLLGLCLGLAACDGGKKVETAPGVEAVSVAPAPASSAAKKVHPVGTPSQKTNAAIKSSRADSRKASTVRSFEEEYSAVQKEFEEEYKAAQLEYEQEYQAAQKEYENQYREAQKEIQKEYKKASDEYQRELHEAMDEYNAEMQEAMDFVFM